MATIHPCSTRELESEHLLLTFGFQHKFIKFPRKFVNPLKLYKLSDNMKYDFNPLCQINFTAKQPAYVHSIEIRALSRYFDPVGHETMHCCRLQAIYSPIIVKNFVTVYTAFNR